MPKGVYPRKPCSEKTKEKISKTKKGKPNSKKHNENIRKGKIGKPLSEEHKQACRDGWKKFRMRNIK